MEKVATFNSLDSFEKLIAWQSARELAKNTYMITRNFPKDEQFGMTNQMRRAANSVAANIAEGFSRQTIADKSHFYAMALSSLTELLSFFYTALDIEYISQEIKDDIFRIGIKTHKLLTGLIKSTKARNI